MCVVGLEPFFKDFVDDAKKKDNVFLFLFLFLYLNFEDRQTGW